MNWFLLLVNSMSNTNNISKLSPIGVFLRNKRERDGESLRLMADKIGISGAYLSAIEIGKRDINERIVDRIIKKYELGAEDINKIKFLAEASKKEVKIKNGDSDIKRELLVEFKRKYSTLSNEKASELLLILHSI